ncbi:ISWI chromatin-remodeling complex ATPase ISW2 protein [Rutstroemia sp. NJR-2017a WRK4]|nr:ISWI chromatin-remodeling complex ATPase ISW2 protein [Rutstroemia sp. NJR-2017a WRK4]
MFLPGVQPGHKKDSPSNSPQKASNSSSSSNGSSQNTSMRGSRQDPDLDGVKGEVEPGHNDEKEDEMDIEYSTVNGRSLRKRKPNNSLKAQENGWSPEKSRRSVADRVTADVGFDLSELNFTPIASKRREIRREIANETTGRRNTFLVDKKDFWLPLLPENNYISKLIEKYKQMSEDELSKLPSVQPYEELTKQPKGVKATMKPYQLSGLSFMLYLHRNGLSGILGDEMGLGKTLQTLSLIQHLKENDPKTGTGRLQRPFLIVCPLSVLSSWMTEAEKWTPGLKAIRFHGPIKERTRLKQIVVGEIDMYGNLTAQAKAKRRGRRKTTKKEAILLDTDSEDEEDIGVDLVVTTYESYRAEQAWFKRAFVWRYVVLDEGHTTEYRLIITGTPLQNNLSELWSLLHFLYPEVFIEQTKALFDTSFNLSKGDFSKDVIDAARHLLELIMLRRMKNSPGVELGLPPKNELLLCVPLTPMQKFWYERLITKADKGILNELFSSSRSKEEEALSKADANDEAEDKQLAQALNAFDENAADGTEAWKDSKRILQETVLREKTAAKSESSHTTEWRKLMNLVMQLRKVCNHPYQIQAAEPDPYYSGDHLIEASGKFIVLEKLINELVIKQKKKILIFSGFTKMLDLVEEFLHLRGGDGTIFHQARIDGGTCRARRNLSIRMLNDLESNYRVMLISTRAGGLGINLASASDVVFLDQDWNPQITLQAIARAHRIGQTNPVTVYKLVSQGTVEEQMMGRIQKKLYLSAKVTESMEDIHTKFGAKKNGKQGVGGGDDDEMPQMDTSQLMTLIRRGVSAISRPDIDVHEMLKWDWETTVAKCKDQPADITIKKDVVQDADIDEELERKWLTEVERVESKILNGKLLARGKPQNCRDIAADFNATRADRRVGKNTTVLIDGYMVSKDTVNNGKWEAVKTISSTDHSFADRKREKKAAIEPQSHCQICMDGGSLVCCNLCPRAYHVRCLDKEFQVKAKGAQFVCPQHQCGNCGQKTGDVGGMLYRCRWCEKAECEDCLDWQMFKPVGDNLIEYELLGFKAMTQAFYVQCRGCSINFAENEDDKTVCDTLEKEWTEEWEKRFGQAPDGDFSEATSASMERTGSAAEGSLTDAMIIDTPGLLTPTVNDEEIEVVVTPRKRKHQGEVFDTVKREKVRAF